MPPSFWPRALGLVAVAAGTLLMVRMTTPTAWRVLACAALIFGGAALVCGALDFLGAARREARSVHYDAQATGTIVHSELGSGYSDSSPLLLLTVAFEDRHRMARRARVHKVVPLNELALHAVGQAVHVRYASAAPERELVITPLAASAPFPASAAPEGARRPSPPGSS